MKLTNEEVEEIAKAVYEKFKNYLQPWLENYLAKERNGIVYSTYCLMKKETEREIQKLSEKIDGKLIRLLSLAVFQATFKYLMEEGGYDRTGRKSRKVSKR